MGTNEPQSPWHQHFIIDGVAGGPVKLRQTEAKTFVLESDIRYEGETGLEGMIDAATMDDIRWLPKPMETDLASVPGPLRWFLGAYGAHTPAVLIHDRLIPTPPHLQGKMTDQYTDRYLRFMTKDVGMRWLKRWVMWAGVAMRTRWATGKWRQLTLVVWIVAAVLGISAFTRAALDGNVAQMILAVLAIFVAAGLWDRQYGAGAIAGIAAPWLLPPSILAIVGYLVYLLLEFLFALVWTALGKPDIGGSGSYRPDGL